MRTRTIVAGVSALAIAAAVYHYVGEEEVVPPTREQEGETVDNGVIVKKKTVDYVTLIRTAVADTPSFITLKVSRDKFRDRQLETSIIYTPLPSSTALIRVYYNVQYAIGHSLRPGRFSVTGGAEGLVVTLDRPRLVTRPSVRLKSYKVLDSGFLIDERTALLELQQNILPKEQKLAAQVVALPTVTQRSEQVLRRMLQTILKRQGVALPPITIKYR